MSCLRLRERLQVIVDDDPLSKLGHVDPLQQCVEVRLAGKNELQLQRFPIVQIGQKPQFFKQLSAKTLGFVDNENDPSGAVWIPESETLKRDDRLQPGRVVFGSTQGKAESRAGDVQCRSAHS